MAFVVALLLSGLAAQLVDGALGMGYGVTSATLLLALGLAPAALSASIHLAEIATTAASGLAHWRLGNVNKGVVVRIAVPGAVGAFCGAVLLADLSTAAARPAVAALLLTLGASLLVRFVRASPERSRQPPTLRLLVPLGLTAGFVDATGGGGWGPIATPTLLSGGRLEPRQAIGTVNAAEFAVSVAASAGFLTALGRSAIRPDVVLPLLIGGLIAAPVAALFVSRVPRALLGVGVGGLLVLTSGSTLLAALGVHTALRAIAALAVVATVGGCVFAVLRRQPGATERPSAGEAADDASG